MQRWLRPNRRRLLPAARPLSPHLGIYRLTLTMAMSIVHRITGAGLYVGVLLLAWFLIAASMDAAAFAYFSAFIQSIFGRLILFGFTWALFHHMLGGVRHLDLGRRLRHGRTRARPVGAGDADRRPRADDRRLGHRSTRSDEGATVDGRIRQVLRTAARRASAISARRARGTRGRTGSIHVTSVALVPLTIGFVWLLLTLARTRTTTASAPNWPVRCRRSSCCCSCWPASPHADRHALDHPRLRPWPRARMGADRQYVLRRGAGAWPASTRCCASASSEQILEERLAQHGDERLQRRERARARAERPIRSPTTLSTWWSSAPAARACARASAARRRA